MARKKAGLKKVKAEQALLNKKEEASDISSAKEVKNDDKDDGDFKIKMKPSTVLKTGMPYFFLFTFFFLYDMLTV